MLSTLELPIDSIPLNVAVYQYENDDFIFVDFNKMAEETDNITKEQLIGKRLTEVFPGVKEFGLFDVLVRVHKNGGTEEIDLGFYEDERVRGWRKNQVTKLANGNVVALYTDKTVEKETEKQLQSFSYIIDNHSSEVFIFDVKTFKFSYANQAALNNIAYSLQELKEMTPSDIKPEYNMQRFKEIMNLILSGEKDSLIYETVHQRKDGSYYDVESRIHLMSFDKQNQFVVFANDISKRKKAELELYESEEQFRAIAENSLMGVFIYQENMVYVNQALIDISEYNQDELYKMKPWDYVQKKYRKQLKEVSKRRLKGKNFPKEYNDMQIITKLGTLKYVRVSTQTIKYKGKYAGLGTIVDITDIIETKKQLKLLVRAVEQMDEMVRITDVDGKITYVNEAFSVHTGYEKVELLGKNTSMFRSGKHDNEFYKDLWTKILSGERFKDVFINRKKDKQLFYEEQTITPIIDTNNKIQNFVGTGHDITQRVEMEEELHTLATTDSLTSVYNRYKISEELDIELARAKRYEGSFSFIMLDIDFFKDVNDNYGHDMGDRVLQELSKIILNLIRESDRFGRWGGEEFVIISPYTKKDKVLQFANKIREAVENYIFTNINQITISAGVTIYTKGDIKENILKRADEALYESKENGRNRVTFK